MRKKTWTPQTLLPGLEHIVRVAHVLGTADAPRLLAQVPATWDAKKVANALTRLIDLGWLEETGELVRQPVGRPARVVCLTAAALAVLPKVDRLPLRPGDRAARPAPYTGQRAPAPRIDRMGPAWQPPPAAILRAGADDHKRYASHGVGC
ncbi:hypothetical protein [Ottowia sp.]|uniref:hypothetical protein n=1 Tax=Ottowia sp. TaxID=1898956 RepID=UPI003A88B2CE